MNIMRAGLDAFAKLVGVDDGHAEDALHSERAAKHVLNRRSLLGTLGAMATGMVMPLPLRRKRYEAPCFKKFVIYVNGTRIAELDAFSIEFDIGTGDYQGLVSI